MSRLWRFVLPISMLLLGAASVFVAGRGLFDAFRQDGTLFQGPAKTSVSLEKPGDYTLWIQNRATLNGRVLSFPTDLPSGAVIEVMHETTGKRLPLSEGLSGTMSINDMERRSIGFITLAEPGPISISVSGMDSPRLFYLDESFGFGGVLLQMSLGAVGFCLILAGFVVGIYFLIRPKPRQYHTLQPPGSVAI